MYHPLNVFWCTLVALLLLPLLLLLLLLLILLLFVGITGDVKFGIVLLVVEMVVLVDVAVAVGVVDIFIFVDIFPPVPNDDNVVFDTGTEADEVNCCGGHNGDNSCKPRSFSNSFGSLAPGKSCLFAKIKIGTPCKMFNIYVLWIETIAKCVVCNSIGC